MSKNEGELPIPPAALDDPKAIELRVWAAGGKQHVTMATGLWKDAGCWGICLADLARHVANAYEQLEGRDKQETMDRIRAGLEAEWDHPTDEPQGKIEE